MSPYTFKMILSFIHANHSTEEDSNFVQKSNTNSCPSLENIKLNSYCELLSSRTIQEKSSCFQSPQLFAFLHIAYV